MGGDAGVDARAGGHPDGDAPDLDQCGSTPEQCNGADDDCNGVPDDEPAAGADCVRSKGPGWVCAGGQCSCPQTACAGGCIDTKSDVRHCGGCNNACPSGAT